ncbi:MAG: rhamnulokinase [Ruminococcaceae bacterium]|nr:rhamnulokinase [Oscillospiraceae bacterium]
MKKILAIDLGASSGRGILASLENGKIQIEEIHRFPNNGVKVGKTLYWDIIYLFDQIKQAMVKANNMGGFDFIGIDTWGVDFGIIDKNGELVSNPVHYRDARCDNMIEEFKNEMTLENLYDETGIQILNFNTIFQLYYVSKYRKEQLDLADKILFIPDLLNYFLTGVKKNEYTIASTSQMLDPHKRNWNEKLLEKIGLDKELLCDIIKPGEVVGELTDEVCEELQIEKAKVIAVGSHDTASAVVSVPSQEDDFVYISCGTWSLFGTELKEPSVTKEGMKSSYTNEGGYDGTIRYLTNIMGLWLIQESRRTWIKQGKEYSFYDLEQLALASEGFKCFIDPDYPEFGKPGDIPKRIQQYCERTNQYVPQTVGEIVRCIYESLALKYKYSFENLKKLAGKDFKSINIVGGGTKDPLLCKMCADACGVNVFAGPIEATALGNIAVQLIAAGEIKDLKEARKIIANSFELKSYSSENTEKWNEISKTYNKLMEK